MAKTKGTARQIAKTQGTASWQVDREGGGKNPLGAAMKMNW